jgi:hypothetical protein
VFDLLLLLGLDWFLLRTVAAAAQQTPKAIHTHSLSTTGVADN